MKEEIATSSLVIVIVNYCICIVSLFSLYILRDIQPIKARSMTLLVVWLFSIALDSTFLFLKMYFGEHCLRDIWLDYVGSNAVLFLITLRAARLLVIFNVTKSRLEDNEAEEKKSSWWVRVEYAQEPFLFKIVCALLLLLVVVPIGVSIYTGYKGDLEAACEASWAVTLKYVSMGIAILLIILLAVQLRKVHDGYYLKDEFRILAIYGAGVVVPFVIVFGAIYVDGDIANILSLAAMGGLLVISYVIPIYKAWKTYYYESKASSNVSSTEKNYMSSSVELQESGPLEKPFFTGFPHIAKLMADADIYPFLNSYIIHFQEVAQSDCLVFWLQIREFRKIERKEFLAGKAYLLFQKYLKRDGYRHIDCISDDQISTLDQKIKESMQEDGPELESSFFDQVFVQLEVAMAEYLFPGFMSSKFYAEYKTATRLKMNLETVIVK